MALSRLATQDADGVELLRQSARYFNESLKQFRICHDLCVSSDDVLNIAAVSDLDRCGVQFRQLSSFGATLSEKVANVWCGTCSMFYRNLSKLQAKNPGKILNTISGNAKELAEGFVYLSDRANDLCKKFQSMELGSQCQAVQEAFVLAFQEHERKAEALQAESKRKLDEAKRKTEAAKEARTRSMWKPTSLIKAASNVITEIIPQAQAVIEVVLGPDEGGATSTNLENAMELESKAKAELREAERKLKKQADQRKKAEFLAGELTKLMQMLHAVSAIFDHVGNYFKEQADVFAEMSEATTGEELETKYELSVERGKGEAEHLTKQKELLDTFHRTMAVVNSSYNFQPVQNEQHLPSTALPPIQLEKLGIGCTLTQ